jgi:mannose-6-phosphate isomerase-like protein (cupin superfamily)
VTVTDRQGKVIQNAKVTATGPMERESSTDSEGTVILRNVTAGTYRLRFDHEAFLSFEKEVTVGAGRPIKTTAALTPAPPPPAPPPPPKPDPAPAAAPPPPPPSGPPTSVDVPTFVEKNYIGGSPSKTSQIGCTGTSSATLMQLRDPLAQHSHADADELLYIVAGEGVQRIGTVETNLTAGTLAIVPRGTPHTITRKGNRPVIMLSILTGPPCTGAAK